MSETKYWIWLQSCIGIAKSFQPLIDYFGSIEELYNSNYLQRKVCPYISDKSLALFEKKTLDDAQRVIDLCKKEGWQIITYEDEIYPKKLKNIYDPPIVLYVCGDLMDLDNNLTLGVVGTRKASPYALEVARVISKGVARCGGIIVSGGALGIDSSAHKGALEIEGKTIAVLGCGFGSSYLQTNADLRRQISNSGAVITEFQPGTPASRFTFPPRNRIISGLSDGVFVVEASNKSGSLITANYATSQNRDLFATPASIFDTRFSGTNRLIEDGAIVVTSPKVIIEYYLSKYENLDSSKIASVKELLTERYTKAEAPEIVDEQMTFENIKTHRKNQNVINEKAMMIKGNEKLVFDALEDEFIDVDSLSRKTSLAIKDVLMSLTMLELDGLAEAGMGKRYRRKQP